MNKEQLISEMLLLPASAIDYHTRQHLLKLFPDKALIESEMGLNIEGYAAAGHCTITRKTFTYNQASTYWRGPEPEMLRPHHMMMHMRAMGGFSIDGMNPSAAPATAQATQATETHDMLKRGWLEVQWQDNMLDMLILQIQGEGFQAQHIWILAETEEVARGFFAAVSKWNMEIVPKSMVF